ncbi:MAG: DUF3810 domain-containing protein [Bacteroidales bacterium]|nr:DUF3810 domain-containing protein [Bacteroidales bacterium]
MKKISFTTLLGLLLALISVACRYSTALADFYSTRIYPWVSAVLSWLAAWSPINLEEIAIAVILVLLIVSLCRKVSWKHRLANVGKMLLWTYVWFYWGWCINYSRSNIYARIGALPEQYDQAELISYANDFVNLTNLSWTDEPLPSQAELEAEIKQFYAQVPKQYGLSTPRSWQHPKTSVVNGVYSASGICGFMAPLFAESCINSDILLRDYPFTYAHEYAHLMGVSSEAEANWWAFQACTHSSNPAVRYSGYKGIITYIMNDVYRSLGPDEYNLWRSAISPSVVADLRATSQHWRSLRSEKWDSLQNSIYDLFLKGNNVEGGMKNYSYVVSLLISLEPDFASKDVKTK